MMNSIILGSNKDSKESNRMTSFLIKNGRMSEHSPKQNKLLQIILILLTGILSLVFLSLFSYYSSPITTVDNGADAAFFRLVGQGMTKGYLPYRDFFDMKGPFLFFIEYIGQLISYGRMGVFIMQWINLTAVLLVICKIFDLSNVKSILAKLGLLLPILCIASFTFEGGNLTEEFSLFEIFSCLYIGLLYIEKIHDESVFWQRKIFLIAGLWFGISFGLLLMIRITNAAFICAIVLVILLQLIARKRFLQIIIAGVSFIVGLTIAIVPAVLFFASKGLFYELIDSMFILGFKYSGEKSFVEHVVEAVLGERKLLIFLIIVPACVPFVLRWRSWMERLLVLTGALFSFFAVMSGNNYMHYYTLVIPLLVLCEMSVLESMTKSTKFRRNFACVLIAFMFVSQLPFMYSGLRTTMSHLLKPYKFTDGQSFRDISSRIPSEDRDSVFCYNINPAWYTYTDLFPCIKYCGWQEHYISLMPEIYDNLEETFDNDPPSWLVLPKNIGILPEFLDEMIDDEYRLVYQNETCLLYNYSE